MTTLAFSDDGNTLASGSYDQTVIVWDVESGRMRRLFRPQMWLSSLVFSADGTTLACDSGHVWDIPSGRLLRRSYRYGSPLARSEDGRMLACSSLASGADGFSLLVTTLHTGRTLHRFSWYPDEPHSIAFSSDGNLLAAASYEGGNDQEDLYITAIFNLKTGERRTIRYDQPVCLFGVALGAGVRLVAVSPEGSQLWNAETGEALPNVIAPDDPQDARHHAQCVCLSPDGRLLAGGTDNGVLDVWSVATSERLWQQQAHHGWLREIAISRDGRTLATAGDDSTVRLWDAWSGTPGHTLGGRGASIEAVAFQPDGETITSLSTDGTTRLWRITPPSCERREIRPDLLPRTVPRKPDTIRNLWSSPTTALPIKSDLPKNTSIAARSPDGALLALWQSHKKISVWDRNHRVVLSRIPAEKNHYNITPVFSPDNRLLAIALQNDMTVSVFDVQTGKVQQTFAREAISRTAGAARNAGGVAVVELAFSPDSQLLAMGHFGFTVTLWSMKTGQRRRLFWVPGDSVSTLAFTPKADILAIGTDYDARVWLKRLTRCGKSVQLIGHTNSIRSADFSPDGSRIITGALDATVRLWEPENGRLLATFLALPGEDWVVYTPQGDYTGSPGVEGYLFRQVGADLVPVEPDLLSQQPIAL